MSERFRLGYWRFGLASGLVFVASVVVYAQGFPAPGTVVEIADRSPMLAVVYILACVTVASLVFAWRGFSVDQKRSEAIQAIAAASQANANAVNRLVDQLNIRPCIMVPPQAKNPNLLGGPGL